MAKIDVEKRRASIYESWLKTQNMAETGRIFGITRERVRQVVRYVENTPTVKG